MAEQVRPDDRQRRRRGCSFARPRSVHLQPRRLEQPASLEGLRGEISGLSRSVSNPGPSVGTAVVGTILVSGRTSPDRSYAHAMMVLAAIGGIGLVAPHVMSTAPPGSAGGALARPKAPPRSWSGTCGSLQPPDHEWRARPPRPVRWSAPLTATSPLFSRRDHWRAGRIGGRRRDGGARSSDTRRPVPSRPARARTAHARRHRGH